jgi:hypothetical protein
LKNKWSGEHLDFQASLLGQTTTGTVDVADDNVRLEVRLPLLLSLLANAAKACPFFGMSAPPMGQCQKAHSTTRR